MSKDDQIIDHVLGARLLDFYGSILPEKSGRILNLYFNEDFSLAEISEELGMTRQGVHDRLRRSVDQLSQWEEQLGLLRHYEYRWTRLSRLAEIFDRSLEGQSDLEVGKQLVTELLEDLEGSSRTDK